VPRRPSHMTTDEIEDVVRALTAAVKKLDADAARQSMQEAFMQMRAYADATRASARERPPRQRQAGAKDLAPRMQELRASENSSFVCGAQAPLRLCGPPCSKKLAGIGPISTASAKSVREKMIDAMKRAVRHQSPLC
jgi:hypothetical protein